MRCQFFKVSSETELQGINFFTGILFSQGLMNGVNEQRLKCDTLTKRRPDFCGGGVVHCESFGGL